MIKETGRRSDSEDKTMASGLKPAGISDVGKWRISDPIAFTMC